MKMSIKLLTVTFLLFLGIISCESQEDQKELSKYNGKHHGNWEGYVLNKYMNGSSEFNVSSDGSASLRLSGELNVTHSGKVKGNQFITSKGQSCSIVDMNGGFKIVLIWTGVNVDVNFF